MNIRTLLLPALIASALFASSAQAATADATLLVKLVISGTCGITTDEVNFGSVTNLSTALQVSGAIKVECTLQTPYSVALDKGLGSGASVTARKMTNLADTAKTASYELRWGGYNGSIWGDSTGGSIFSSAGTGAPQNHVVYGIVNAQAHPGDGSYQDTVTATITW